MSKYKKVYHDSLIKSEMDEIRALHSRIRDIKAKAKEKFTFSNGDRVAVMDLQTGKFKKFAYVYESYFSDMALFIRLQAETKHGKKDKRIDTLSVLEFIVAPEEVDTSDVYVEPKIENLKL